MLPKNYPVKHLLSFIVIIWVFLQSPASAQETSIFETYHPPYTQGIGKWHPNKQDSIIIKCYIKQYIDTNNNKNIADTIFRKALNTWNQVFQKSQLKIRFDIQSLQNTGYDTIVGSFGSKINILAIGTKIVPNIETTYGITVFNIGQKFIDTNGQRFTKPLVTHIELNALKYTQGKLPLYEKTNHDSQVSRNSRLNAFIVAVHELGHLLGMDHNVSPLSVMVPGRKKWTDDLENYDGNGEIPLQPIDSKYLKTIYSQFFLTNEQRNSSCLPRSTR